MRKTAFILLPMLFLATPALAHLDPVEHGSFAAGFTHPVSGLDHILAMVAVGLWAALLPPRGRFLVPAAFVVAMMAGFLLALLGGSLPFVEPAILASGVVIGLLAAVALKVDIAVGAALVGFFALFHGYAHGGEMGSAGALAYAGGFALATAVLHGVGIAFGNGLGRIAIRTAGAATALASLCLAAGIGG
ncbi:HupE/UreJ family protein [Phyllobacterium sp. 0TCS1.6C]|jgi:urease accessory protein|uniref:HupE/UreJ family protein n=1 Tax=unclassified Phyllobacterium TaxID=2638441 RepID=UPI002263F6B8|nr:MULTISPECIES: HupE/UreJ family protein [unclassified Phyllobacterium]MCX8281495.1 HupE/UreJ family protein [Phyllobacterium sp. 0TCS1.6C]MCX8292909.1 HupE/UreJ family protein [Phyllobacterium sp. 0TCS1.6A]